MSTTPATEVQANISQYPVTDEANAIAQEFPKVPKKINGVSRLLVDSESEFQVSLDGRKVATRHLEVNHPKPMTVYGIRGMESAGGLYVGTGLVEIGLEPRKGMFKVTSIETDPTEKKLAIAEKAGATLYICPREIIVGNRVYNDLDLVKVCGLGSGKVRLFME